MGRDSGEADAPAKRGPMSVRGATEKVEGLGQKSRQKRGVHH